MATNTGAPYTLPYPEADDLADVPHDIQALAAAVVTALNGKLSPADGNALYQKQIKFVTGGAPPTTTTGYDEGDVIFVLP